MLTLFYYTLWTVSALLFGFLIQAALDRMAEGDPSYCGKIESWLLFSSMVVSFLVLSVGCIWSSLAFWNVMNDNIDEYLERSYKDSVPTSAILFGKLLWHVFYSGFLIVGAHVWSSLARQTKDLVGGLVCSSATAIIVLSQMLTIALLLFSAVGLAKEGTWGKVTSDNFFTVVFNYCMLMSCWSIKSFFLSVFPTLNVCDGKELDSTDDENDDVDKEFGKVTKSFSYATAGDKDKTFYLENAVVSYHQDDEEGEGKVADVVDEC
jgi:hypothetical protein